MIRATELAGRAVVDIDAADGIDHRDEADNDPSDEWHGQNRAIRVRETVGWSRIVRAR